MNIDRLISIHENKYDYSQFVYVRCDIKGKVICPKHGEFWITYNSLYRGRGCSACGKERVSEKLTFTFDDFLLKAIGKHGDRYDYSKFVYVNVRTKGIIICKKHGEFTQTPSSHFKGQGCPSCSNVKKLTTKEFISKSKAIHGNKYDYSKTKYINGSTKVYIICKKHGGFWQKATSHLQGKSCYKCKCDLVSNKLSGNKNEFISKAKKVHGEKYDYSKVDYTMSRNKVCIICKEHGEFLQEPRIHLSGKGCLKCRMSKLESSIELFLINNKIKFEPQKRFDWLGRKSLDFYLPDYNIAIECQGLQHYESVNRFGGEKMFRCARKNDLIKFRQCRDNDIKLLYYTNVSPDIINIFESITYFNPNDLLLNIKQNGKEKRYSI